MTDLEHWEQIRGRVCVNCVDSDGEGGCQLSSDSECAVKRYFPEILAVINAVRSERLAVYELQLRNRICGMCVQQSKSGVCSLQNEIDCALDRHFPVIVQTVRASQGKTSRITSGGYFTV